MAMNESRTIDFDVYIKLTNASYWVYRIWSVGFILLGITGNSLAMIIFLQWANRLSVYVYLTLLCIVNILIVVFDITYHYLLPYSVANEILIEDLLPMTCQFMSFLTYFLRYLFIWLIVMINLDRCLFLTEYSLKAILCRQRSARIISIIVVLFSILANCHFLIFFNKPIISGIATENQCALNGIHQYCQSSNRNYQYFLDQIWPIYNLIVFAIVPIMIMIICCILILRNICLTRRNVVNDRERRGSNSSLASQGDHLRSVTKTLICLDLLFVITIFPMLFFQIFLNYHPPKTCLYIGILNLVFSLGCSITFIKNTFAFLIFYVTGRKFRRAFSALIYCKNISTYRESR